MKKNLLKQFIVPCYDKPGTLGKILSALGKAGINVSGISTYSTGAMAYISFTAEPAAKVESALKAEGFPVFWNNVVAVTLPNKPGELGKFATYLGQEGINIQTLFGYSGEEKEATFLFSVQDFEKSQKTIESALSTVA